MAARTILLVAVAIFSSVVIALADDAPKLPSRKASVVIPLLEKIKSGGDAAKIFKILGQAHVGAIDQGLFPSGPSGAGQTPLRCVLDDGTIIDMQVWSIPGHGNGIIRIGLKRTNGTTEQIYSSSE